jgi:L-ascorbate metabolism protein UlaG (beta-lactamase superfamily)
MKKAIGYFWRAVAGLVIALCLIVTVIPPFLDRIYYDGPKNGHYDGNHFFNPDGDDTAAPPTGGSRGGFLINRVLQSASQAWPDMIPFTPAKPRTLPPLKVGEMRAIWVGHASVLIQTPTLNILTDPIWANRAGPFGFGPARVTKPGIAFDDLPKINIVVVSHNHYDHMDLATLKRLWDRDRPQIYTPRGNETLMKGAGIEAIAVDWGEGLTVQSVCEEGTLCENYSVMALRNHHWSSRWFADRNRALWSSFLIKLPGGNLYFAGDTGYGDGQWGKEAAAFGPVRLALIPIGAFRFAPGQMHIASHIGPIQAERIFASINPAKAIAIHWGTFKLSDEARDTPPKMLAEVIKCAGYADPSVFAPVPVGAPVMIPSLPTEGIRPAPPAPDAQCLNDPAITALP